MADAQVTWRDKLRYRFENTLSKGTIAIIGWLALASGRMRSDECTSITRSVSRNVAARSAGRASPEQIT